MVECRLFDHEKEFLLDNEDLIKQEDWDRLFSRIPSSGMFVYPNIYPFLCSFTGKELLHHVSHIYAKMFQQNRYLEQIDIPDNIKSIDSKAFQWCENLYRVSIHPNMYIGASVFAKCGELKSITFLGTKQEFTIGTDKWFDTWAWQSSITTISCSDGSIKL